MAIFNSYVKLPDGKSKLLLKLTFARFCLETGLVCCSVATTRCRQDEAAVSSQYPSCIVSIWEFCPVPVRIGDILRFSCLRLLQFATICQGYKKSVFGHCGNHSKHHETIDALQRLSDLPGLTPSIFLQVLSTCCGSYPVMGCLQP